MPVVLGHAGLPLQHHHHLWPSFMHYQYRGTVEDGILYNSPSSQNNENQTEEDFEVGREEEAQDIPSGVTTQQSECENEEQEPYLEL